MKKRNIFAIGCLTMMLGLGAFAGVSNFVNSDIKTEAYDPITIYCAIDENTLGDNTLCLSINYKGDDDWWYHDAVATDTNKTFESKKVFSFTITTQYGGLGAIQFKTKDSWGAQIEFDRAFGDRTWTPESDFAGKLWVFYSQDSGRRWRNVVTITQRFIVDGEDNNSPLYVYHESGTTYNVPAEIYRSGEIFDKWYDSDLSKEYKATTISSDYVIYGKYTTHGNWTGSIFVDFGSSQWDMTSHIAIYFWKEGLAGANGWSTYCSTQSGTYYLSIPYSLGFNPTNMLLRRYNTNYSESSWNSGDKFNPGEGNNWGKTGNMDKSDYVVIGSLYDDTNGGYETKPSVRSGISGQDWSEVGTLSSIKYVSGHVVYYSNSLVLTKGNSFKTFHADGANGLFTTHNSLNGKFTGGGESDIYITESGTYAMYYDSVTHNTYITKEELELADDWAKYFNDNIGCDGSGSFSGDWEEFEDDFNDNERLNAAAREIFRTAAHVDKDAEPELILDKAIQKYDYIVCKYGTNTCSDFMNRGNGEGGSGKIDPKEAFVSPLAVTENNGTLVASAGVVTIALFAGAGFLLLKKKKEI